MIDLRAYLVGGALLAFAVGAGYISHLQTAKKVAEQEAATANAQSSINEGTAQAIDRVIIEERRITEEVTNVIREIDALPSGDALVPPDVAAAWVVGIDSLRDNAASPADSNPGKPKDLPQE